MPSVDCLSDSITFTHPLLKRTLVLPQNPRQRAVDCFDATSRFVWQACMPLCTYLCEHADIVKARVLVELGAGATALPSHVAAALGASLVVATDGDSSAVQAMQERLRDGGDEEPWTKNINACSLRWGDDAHARELMLTYNDGKPVDVVLCSDLLYGHDAATSGALLETIRTLLGDNPNGVCLMSYQFRDNLLGELDFFERVSDTFESEAVSLPRHDGSDDGDDDLWLFTLTQKKPPAYVTVSSTRLCAFDQWAPRCDISILLAPFKIVPLPPWYIRSLRAGGTIVAPEGHTSFAPPHDIDDYAAAVDDNDKHYDEDDDEEEKDDNNDDDVEREQLKHAVESAMRELDDSACAPKLRWSAPKDATFMSCDGTLRCTSFDEVDLLMRSSDSIAYDVNTPFEGCADVTNADHMDDEGWTLALRSWRAVNPMLEFRCFVRKGKLIAASQRDPSTHFDTLHEMLSRDNGSALVEALDTFWERKLKPNLPKSLVHCAFDAYTTPKGDAGYAVRVMDVNVFGPPTLPLMFDWSELHADELPWSSNTEIRWVREATHIRPGLKSALPIDLITSASDGDGDSDDAGERAKRLLEAMAS